MGLLSLWEIAGDSNYAPELDRSPTRPETRGTPVTRMNTRTPKELEERRITTRRHLLKYSIKLCMHQRTPYLIGIVVM
jgi:hypothetical protein